MEKIRYSMIKPNLNSIYKSGPTEGAVRTNKNQVKLATTTKMQKIIAHQQNQRKVSITTTNEKTEVNNHYSMSYLDVSGLNSPIKIQD